MFNWLKRISFFKQYREPVDTILKGLQSGKFEVSTMAIVSALINVRCVHLRHDLCEISITQTDYLGAAEYEYTSSTDDWMTTEELQAVYGLAHALYNAAARVKMEQIERMNALALASDQQARMLEVAKQLGVTNV